MHDALFVLQIEDKEVPSGEILRNERIIADTHCNTGVLTGNSLSSGSKTRKSPGGDWEI
jgi:hypothetical protein